MIRAAFVHADSPEPLHMGYGEGAEDLAVAGAAPTPTRARFELGVTIPGSFFDLDGALYHLGLHRIHFLVSSNR